MKKIGKESYFVIYMSRSFYDKEWHFCTGFSQLRGEMAMLRFVAKCESKGMNILRIIKGCGISFN